MKGETLTGKILVNDIGIAALILEKNSSGTGSTSTGTINNADTGKTVTLTLDTKSTRVVTGTSYLTKLTDAASSYSNILCETAGCKVHVGSSSISPRIK